MASNYPFLSHQHPPVCQYSTSYIILTCRCAGTSSTIHCINIPLVGTPSTICCFNRSLCWYSQHHILTYPQTIYWRAGMLVLPTPYTDMPVCWYSQRHILTCRYAGTPNTMYWHAGMLVLPTPYVDMRDFGRPQRNIKIGIPNRLWSLCGMWVVRSCWKLANGCSLHLGKGLQKPSCEFIALASWG
jgi:hypothetical protein